MLPWDMEKAYVPYDLTHTLTQLQLLFFSALAFVWLNKKGLYPPELKSVNLDFEWLYRKVLPTTGHGLARFATYLKSGVVEIAVSAVNSLPVMKRGNDANAATLTLRMALGFVVLAILAFVTQFM